MVRSPMFCKPCGEQVRFAFAWCRHHPDHLHPEVLSPFEKNDKNPKFALRYAPTVEKTLLGREADMKAPKFRHPRGTAPRQGLALCLLLALLYVPSPALAQRMAELDFVCPCTIEYHGPATVKVKLGVKNWGETASKRFKLRIEASLESSGDIIGDARHVFDPLAPGAAISGENPIIVPINLTKGAEPDNSAIRFVARLETEGNPNDVAIPKASLAFTPSSSPLKTVSGSGAYLYIEGTPVLRMDGDRATVTVPKLVNAGPHAVTVSSFGFDLRHATHAAQHSEQDGYHSVPALRNVNPPALTVLGRGSAVNVSFSGDWVQPTSRHPYTFLHLFGSSEHRPQARVQRTLVARGGRYTPATSDFGSATGIDYLADADGDGASDYNERLLGTQPDDSGSKPEAPVLYILAVYPPAMTKISGEPPLAVITHHVEWANMALRNSRIDARFKLANAREGNTSLDIRSFSDERQASGADLLVLYRTSVNALGRASLLDSYPKGRRGEGDEHGVSMGPGGAGVFAHELGHNLGLAHSVRQETNGPIGLFRWSRGHGVEWNFSTLMAYPAAYRTSNRLQYFSNPDLHLCHDQPCGVERDQPLTADGALSINTVMHQVAQWAPDPPDDDGDGVPNLLDGHPKDPAKAIDTDGDNMDDNTDPDDDNDGLTDEEEATLGTNPRRADTDGDGVNDKADAFPNDETESVDADGDGVGANRDAADNDAGVTWHRWKVTLTPDAVLAANLIATFDDTTEGPAAIRADTTKYEVTGVFADPDIDIWDVFHLDIFAPRVGAAAVSTWGIGGATGAEAMGTIKIKGVTIAGDYLNFLMTGGTPFAIIPLDLGIKLFSAGTDIELASWKPGRCDSTFQDNDLDWRHFDVSALTGQSVDILIYDNNDHIDNCRYITFDHFYQSDSARGELVGTATAPPPVVVPLDTDGDKIPDSEDTDDDNDGTPDANDAFPLDDTETTDTDSDRIGNNADLDDDGDGTPDADDAFPLDPNETTDTDGDRIGNNADPDDDNDGLTDIEEAALGTNSLLADTDGDNVGDNADAFPNDASETADSDGDGVGDNADAFPNDRTETADSDSDGVGDNADAFPNDRTETADSDGDGVGDNADAFPNDSSETADSDNDGIGDNADAFPNDRTETADSDGDGVGDNADAFPNDRTETADGDSDGVGDNADAFPNDRTETADSDSDGVGDNADAFPNDRTETADSDSDGVGDNADAFPNDRTETADSDGDGVGDNADAFPNDRTETADSDGDGIGDNADAFPNDRTETADSDNDGVGDNADAFPNDRTETADSDGDGVGDNADAFPNDRTETADSDSDGVGDNADAFPNDRTETADSDSDGVGDNADAFPNDRTETADSDGDGVGDNADAFPNDSSETADSDNDGVGDNREAAQGTNPKDADSDNDGVNDMDDALPLDPGDTVDTDGDGIGNNRDIAPSDPDIAYEADKGSLHPDGKNASKVIADFDDIGVMRLNTRKYTLTDVFADPDLTHWNRFEAEDEAAAAANRASGN